MDSASESWQGVACHALDGPASLRLESFPRRALGAGEVRVRLSAAGVNFPDLLMTRGAYQYRPDLPFVPGMEGAGLVAEVAPGVTTFSCGQRVMVSARTGTFATEVVVPVSALLAAPETFSMTEAACFRTASHTALHALLDRAALARGETLLVLGAAGGIGLAGVEIGSLLGARVIAAASSEEKLAIAASRGASELVNYARAPLVDQVRALAPDGVEVILDPVGGALFEQALRLPAWNGRFLVVGFASGSIGIAAANRVLIRGFSLIGVRAGEAVRRDPALGARSAARLAAWAAEGHLRPHLCATLPLRRAAEALALLASRQAIGRIALVADESVK
jgi:NADPH2:quinone reductase